MQYDPLVHRVGVTDPTGQKKPGFISCIAICNMLVEGDTHNFKLIMLIYRTIGALPTAKLVGQHLLRPVVLLWTWDLVSVDTIVPFTN
jgi:hypothetical protein